MSISRAFTLRGRRSETTMSTHLPLRAGSLRSSDKPVDIRKISGPLALLSTTNMLSYNAPDVSAVRAQRKASNSVSSSSSRSSAEDSDSSAASHLSHETALTDISAPASPLRATRSFYRISLKRSTGSAPRRSASSTELRQQSEVSVDSSPEVPQRAPSHSKRAHERLAKQRSLQHVSNHSSVQSVSMQSISEDAVQQERRSSFDFFTADIDKAVQHPFGKELEQLDEVVEEFGGAVRDAERDNDFAVMRQQGLGTFCADDYLREIRPLFSRIFSQPTVAWI